MTVEELDEALQELRVAIIEELRKFSTKTNKAVEGIKFVETGDTTYVIPLISARSYTENESEND